jgi:hypothetical protein
MKKCTKCGIEKELNEFNKSIQTKDGYYNYCRVCALDNLHKSRAKDGYTADNIKILSNQEAVEDMPWLQIESLAKRYNKDVDFVKRGIEACLLADVSPNYFIDRYLKGNKDIPVDESVAYQSRELQHKESKIMNASHSEIVKAYHEGKEKRLK